MMMLHGLRCIDIAVQSCVVSVDWDQTLSISDQARSICQPCACAICVRVTPHDYETSPVDLILITAFGQGEGRRVAQALITYTSYSALVPGSHHNT